MKTSLVITVLNEEKTIENLLRSIGHQTVKPDEVIIVDGGSTDKTLSVISNFQFPISNKKIKLVILQKNGNRAVCRNEGILRSRNEIILITDAGCILEKKWVERISEPFKDSSIDVVAGYYKGKPKTIFEKCLVPYILVMPDRVIPHQFLPATRSMAFKKEVWKKVGRFNERFSHNEDYVFAKKLKQKGAKIVFIRNATVYWIPRKNIFQAFVMFFRFALGDSESGIVRPKVLFIFLRFSLGIYLFFENRMFFTFLLSIYVLWSIVKNYKYVRNSNAVLLLPVIQIISDIAVLTGTLFGILKVRWATQKTR
ncbi:MAG: hypothetical protein A3D75_01510 [Candidatus Levybacteria bacterium RIFCSPHIGHO2_02_FULL_37_18]|nr:MAG: hypothetical protein A3D75_01510 [Candidatus Levybacteria bacterium RIFCSPHIGHO2_02_FULL_37_18]OGH33470.1 MAG: hypothetical protein A3A47_04455 [Candidatus Levybacteria bacterium RIFCSPLOWO2_01_FULL_37_20]OGH44031.1 MAG: hypothetical protein A3J14_04770 [Candidatus Levybacteria bacterium RIFCSPLOWO2_02_FULL_37_18]